MIDRGLGNKLFISRGLSIGIEILLTQMEVFVPGRRQLDFYGEFIQKNFD